MRNKRKPYQFCTWPSSASSSANKKDCQFDISSPAGSVESSSTAAVDLLEMNSKRKSTNDSEHSLDVDQYKSLIKSHPLFQLLEYFFFKCERSTTDLNSVETKVNMEELVAALNGQRSGGNDSKFNWKTGNDDLDDLVGSSAIPAFTVNPQHNAMMLTAVKVLRTQLLELEKVDELCRDFCSRYIACLKGKITQEMLMGWSDGLDEEPCSPPPSSSSTPNLFNGNNDDANVDYVNKRPSAIVATMQTPNGQVSIPLLMPLLITTPSLTTSYTSSSTCSTSLPQQPVPKKKPKLDNAAVNWTVNGNSKVIARPVVLIGKSRVDSDDRVSSDAETGPGEDRIQTRSESESGSTSINVNVKGKRTPLPRKAVDILKTWLFQNMRHPYPSEEVKRDLCSQSGLSLLQVNNWFINARRRILQPLLDGTAANSVPTLPIGSEANKNLDPKSSPGIHKNRSNGPEISVNCYSAARYWPKSLTTNGNAHQAKHESRNGKETAETCKKGAPEELGASMEEGNIDVDGVEENC